jgi:hypothetical protein
VVATDYERSRDVHVPPGCNPKGLEMIHDLEAKNGGAALRKILYVQLFRRLPVFPDEFL